jgi:hypothetical protein
MKRKLQFALILLMAVLLPVSISARDISGTYSVTGTNPDGSQYSGTCTVSKISGNTYRFVWSVGNSYEGQGTLVGSRISVEWGDTHPVIYDVLPDGTLDGLWSNGKATETLRPR